MTPRRAFPAVFLLLCAGAAPRPAAAAADPAAQFRKVQAAFERGAPVATALKPAEAAALAAVKDGSVPRDLPARLERVKAFQAVAAPALPSCPKTPKPALDPQGCVREAARAAAADLLIAEPARASAAAEVYVGRYLAPKGQTAAEREQAQRRAEAETARGAQAGAARARRVMSQSGALNPAAVDSLPGALPPASAAAVPGRRTAAQAIAEAKAAKAPGVAAHPIKDVPSPSVADRLRASMADDEEALKYGKDDGSWGTAIGRAVTQAKKAGSGFLAFVVDGETWKRTGRAAADLASDPVGTVKYLPGGVMEAGKTLWHGLKSDIHVAQGEVGEFLEHPTPYQGIAAVGATLAAVSNVLVGEGTGVKTAARQAAKRELAVEAVSAERYSKALIGSAETDLDFTKALSPAGHGDEIRANYQKFTAAGRSETAPAATGLQGRIGVPEERFGKIDELKRQRQQDCARYGITACAIGNGQDVTLASVKDASAEVLVDNARSEVARLEAMKAAGRGDAAAVERKLTAARRDLENKEFFPSEYGLGVSDIKGTLDKMNLPNRSLGFDHSALAAVKGGDAATFRASSEALRREIDTELVKGNAVMAAIYTGMKEGGHTQHAVTILGKGRAVDGGGIVYQVFDSNVGRVSLMPASDLNVYGGVVVGKL